MSLWAIVPLKILTSSKQRLAGVLSPEQRIQLTQAMVEDVLNVLHDCKAIDHVLLVSDDIFVEKLCQQSRAEWLQPHAENGLNEDLAFACQYAEQNGASHCLILHADLPLLNSLSIDRMICQAEEKAGACSKNILAVVPCKAGTGSNLAYAPLPFPVPLVYGKNSYLLFAQQAEKSDVAFYTLSVDDGDLDVDIPADLERLRQRISQADDNCAKATRRVMSEIQRSQQR